MRRLLRRRIQRNRSPKSLARLPLSSIINYNRCSQIVLNVFITQNLMIWNSSEENHNTTSGSCAWKTRSHFPVENTELENWKLESVTKFRFPRPILSFPVSVCYVTSFSNWKTGKLEKLEKCKQRFSD